MKSGAYPPVFFSSEALGWQSCLCQQSASAKASSACTLSTFWLLHPLQHLNRYFSAGRTYKSRLAETCLKRVPCTRGSALQSPILSEGSLAKSVSRKPWSWNSVGKDRSVLLKNRLSHLRIQHNRCLSVLTQPLFRSANSDEAIFHSDGVLGIQYRRH